MASQGFYGDEEEPTAPASSGGGWDWESRSPQTFRTMQRSGVARPTAPDGAVDASGHPWRQRTEAAPTLSPSSPGAGPSGADGPTPSAPNWAPSPQPAQTGQPALPPPSAPAPNWSPPPVERTGPDGQPTPQTNWAPASAQPQTAAQAYNGRIAPPRNVRAVGQPATSSLTAAPPDHTITTTMPTGGWPDTPTAPTPAAPAGPGGFNLANYLQSRLGIATMPTSPETQSYGAGYTGGLDLPSLLAGRFQSGAGTSYSPKTQSAIDAQLADPTGFNSDAVRHTFDDLSGGIDDQFDLDQGKLKEEMASRGLTDSSIGAGRLSDLTIGRRSAKTQLASQLATEQARALASGRSNAITAAAGADTYGNGAVSDLLSRLSAEGDKGFTNATTLDQLRAALKGQDTSSALGWAGALQGVGNDAFSHDLATNAFNQSTMDAQNRLYMQMLGLGG